MRVAIVGGSLGGLFAAALLRRRGHEVQVFERSRSGLEGRGAGLVGQREIFAILRAIGCEHVAHVGVVARERIILDRSGAVIERHSTPQMQISWDHLYRSFREQLGEGEYRAGRAVLAVGQDADRAWLRLDDDGIDDADLVIGADGVGSVVRPAVTGQADEARFAGYVAWRGLLPEAHLPPHAAELLLDRFAFYYMPRSHVLGYVVAGPHGEMEPGQRRYNWVWYRPTDDLPSVLTDRHDKPQRFSLAPGMVPDAARDAMLAAARDFLPDVFADAIAAAATPFIQAIFDYEAPRMANGRIALLGDAAFVVRPHTAMGVAKAAGDSLALVEALGKLPLESALPHYEGARMPLNRAVAAYGRRLGASLSFSGRERGRGPAAAE
ncbi:2-polyprenyl-6-methoxyphenol hydroxylase [Sphingomonas oleivorans]|uniref:2-polyprenyl-6-methoxyphenol hydroxylase n=1 Tax=Sphingomonas oleivorans TaxID=1735121 RepID=A0A2T5FTV2_9SPHN|nr:FAD-dependent monooxygenase [Sphingomonas oleivorans]PTQ07482.1 2-polyprenyl-6-methoxyphenol hydroxylase [Sphingomonas oleivorans]